MLRTTPDARLSETLAAVLKRSDYSLGGGRGPEQVRPPSPAGRVVDRAPCVPSVSLVRLVPTILPLGSSLPGSGGAGDGGDGMFRKR